MKSIVIIASILGFGVCVSAVPPQSPTTAEFINQSELVAIVNVTNVTERVVGKRKRQTRLECAEASVELSITTMPA